MQGAIDRVLQIRIGERIRIQTNDDDDNEYFTARPQVDRLRALTAT